MMYVIVGFTGCESRPCCDRIPAIDEAIGLYIDSAYIPNAVALLIRNDSVVHLGSYGYADWENGLRCDTGSLFRLASQTKAITVVGLMQLWERGMFDIDDKVGKYIPSFAISEDKKDMTIRHLLTHTAGFCYDGEWEREYERCGALAHNSGVKMSLSENIDRMSSVRLKHKSGERFTYANNTDVLGRLIEVLSGEDYVSYIEKRVLEPLEMHDTYFYIPESERWRLVRLYSSDSTGLHAGIDDINCYEYGSYPSPSAGLVGSIMDYGRFCTMILNRGEYKGRRILRESTLEMMEGNAVGDMRGECLGFGMAWDAILCDGLLPKGALRWGGMYGTDYVIDRRNGVIAIMYTNCRPNKSGKNHKSMYLSAVYDYIKQDSLEQNPHN